MATQVFVYAGQYDAGSIQSADIGDGQVSGAKIAADAIDGSKLADNAVDSEHIASGAIDDAHLSSGAKSGVLGSKRILQLVATGDLSNPNGTSIAISSSPETTEFPFTTTAGVIGDGSVVGIPVLLEVSAGNSGQANAFNTNSGKVMLGQKGKYAAQVYKTNGARLVDANTGNDVWAIITASARTTGGTYTIRFYSDEWPLTGSGELTLNNPVTVEEAYSLVYPQIVTLSDMALDALRSDSVMLSRVAAGIAAGAVGTAQLAADAVTADKLADDAVGAEHIQNSAVGTDALADNAVTEAKILDSSITSAKMNDGAVTNGKIGADAVDGSKIADDSIAAEHIADGAIVDAHINGSAAIAESKLADLGKEGASSLLANIRRRDIEVAAPVHANGVVVNQDTATAGLVTAQSSPDMSVQVAAATVYNASGTRIAGAQNTNLAIGAADATNPRYDLISFDASGVATVTAGTPAGSPTVPSLPANHVKLAVVKVAANATTIANAAIYDHRRPAAPVQRVENFTGDGSSLSLVLSRRAQGAVLLIRGTAPQVPVTDGSQGSNDEFAQLDSVEADGTELLYGATYAPGNGQVLTAVYFG
jgi:hypothetical protein